MSQTDAKRLKANVQVAAWVPEELRDRLNEIADSQRRPLSALIRNVLEDFAKEAA